MKKLFWKFYYTSFVVHQTKHFLNVLGQSMFCPTLPITYTSYDLVQESHGVVAF